jgi:hypothetical protein
MLFKKRPGWISEPRWRRLMLQRDRRKHLRRQLIRFIRSPRLARAYAEYRQAIAAADWLAVRTHVQSVAKLAVQANDQRATWEMVNAFERVGCYEECGRLWLNYIAKQPKSVPNEWRGEDLSGKSVLIDLHGTAGDGLGIGYACASFVAKIARVARRTTVIVEPRLVETYRRSFANVEILAPSERARAAPPDYVVLPAMLRAFFIRRDGSPDPDFHFLLPDRARAAELRRAYLDRSGGNRMLVGICWHSSHHGKDLPALHHWRDFIRRADAAFISLQYGDVTRDVAAMGQGRVIVDASINQLKNMEDFAAQVTALDGVITIVNTLANVGGALGVPTVVLRDDWFRRNWPVLSDRTPWYPNVRVAGKDRRDWGEVLEDAMSKLRTMISEQPKAL